MPGTSDRVVLRAHSTMVVTPLPELAAYLEEHLGRRMTALLAGVSDTREVGRWAKGDHTPRHDAEVALRAAYQVFRLLAEVESPPTVRAWFLGMNPQLDDESPVEAIAGSHHRDVLAAARAYVAGG